MSASVRHLRVSDGIASNRVNPVNRHRSEAGSMAEDEGTTRKDGALVWKNVAALKALMARAERELAREPRAYVAVAIVAADKREEQVGRWGWAGSADAGARIAELGRRLDVGARGLRVRVHHDGGALVGSVLLRRARRAGAPAPTLAAVVDSGTDQRLATLEARLVLALKRIDDQTREISTLRAELGRVEHLPSAVTNMHHRLDAVEAVCERLETEPAPAEERDEAEDEHDEDEDEDDEDRDDGYGEDDLDDGDDD